MRILRDKHLLKGTWKLQRLHDSSSKANVPAATAGLAGGLFPGSTDVLELKNTNATTMQSAQNAHTKALKKRYQPEYFKRNGGNIGIAILIIVATTIACAGRGPGCRRACHHAIRP